MNRRLTIAFLAWFALVPFMLSSLARADSSQVSQAGASSTTTTVSTPALQPCTMPKGLNVAETSQADCCKGHKGVCGCRAGKIVCCDGTASPNCTCHGEEGFVE